MSDRIEEKGRSLKEKEKKQKGKTKKKGKGQWMEETTQNRKLLKKKGDPIPFLSLTLSVYIATWNGRGDMEGQLRGGKSGETRSERQVLLLCHVKEEA